MTTTPSNEPTEQKEKQGGIQLPAALDLRDYFAAKVLGGLLFNTARTDTIIKVKPADQPIAQAYAQYCYELSDAMLKERDK